MGGESENRSNCRRIVGVFFIGCAIVISIVGSACGAIAFSQNYEMIHNESFLIGFYCSLPATLVVFIAGCILICGSYRTVAAEQQVPQEDESGSSQPPTVDAKSPLHPTPSPGNSSTLVDDEPDVEYSQVDKTGKSDTTSSATTGGAQPAVNPLAAIDEEESDDVVGDSPSPEGPEVPPRPSQLAATSPATTDGGTRTELLPFDDDDETVMEENPEYDSSSDQDQDEPAVTSSSSAATGGGGSSQSPKHVPQIASHSAPRAFPSVYSPEGNNQPQVPTRRPTTPSRLAPAPPRSLPPPDRPAPPRRPNSSGGRNQPQVSQKPTPHHSGASGPHSEA